LKPFEQNAYNETSFQLVKKYYEANEKLQEAWETSFFFNFPRDQTSVTGICFDIQPFQAELFLDLIRDDLQLKASSPDYPFFSS